MTKFDKETLIETVSYILDKTQGTDVYHVLKILYFANQKHLVKWGAPIINDNFRAYEFGPVADRLYKAMRNNDKYRDNLPELFKQVAYYAMDDAHNNILPRRKPQMDYLSRAAIEALEQSIKENAALTFPQLLEKSHDEAWKEAWERKHTKGDDLMNPISIAKAAGADETMLEYIKEQMEIDMELA